MPLADVVPEQRLTALQEANRVRANRANLKRDLMDGEESIHDLLLEPPDYIQTMHLGDLIRAVPGYGKVRTTRVLKKCHLSDRKSIGTLTARQRSEVRELLEAGSWT